jgi:hypothetical protein
VENQKFPANSLLSTKICGFWAEFEGFDPEFEKFPVNFPVRGKFGLWEDR